MLTPSYRSTVLKYYKRKKIDEIENEHDERKDLISHSEDQYQDRNRDQSPVIKKSRNW